MHLICGLHLSITLASCRCSQVSSAHFTHYGLRLFFSVIDRNVFEMTEKMSFRQAHNQAGRSASSKIFRPHGKMCWIRFENTGHSSKNLDPSQKTLHPSWCSKLVTGLHFDQNVWKYRPMNTVTASFNTTVRQMTEMFQRKKTGVHYRTVSILPPPTLQLTNFIPYIRNNFNSPGHHSRAHVRTQVTTAPEVDLFRTFHRHPQGGAFRDIFSNVYHKYVAAFLINISLTLVVNSIQLHWSPRSAMKRACLKGIVHYIPLRYIASRSTAISGLCFLHGVNPKLSQPTRLY